MGWGWRSKYRTSSYSSEFEFIWSVQRLSCLLLRYYNTYTCYSQNFKTLASLFSWAVWYVNGQKLKYLQQFHIMPRSKFGIQWYSGKQLMPLHEVIFGNSVQSTFSDKWNKNDIGFQKERPAEIFHLFITFTHITFMEEFVYPFWDDL